MELRIKQLLNRLTVLGYGAFELKKIIQEAIGEVEIELDYSRASKLIAALEKYEQLGSSYLYTYSK